MDGIMQPKHRPAEPLAHAAVAEHGCWWRAGEFVSDALAETAALDSGLVGCHLCLLKSVGFEYYCAISGLDLEMRTEGIFG